MMMRSTCLIYPISLTALAVSLSWVGAEPALAGSAYVISNRTGRSVRFVQAQEQTPPDQDQSQKPAKDQSVQGREEPRSGADSAREDAAPMRSDRDNAQRMNRHAGRRHSGPVAHAHHRRGFLHGRTQNVRPGLRLIYRRPLTGLYLDTQSTRLVDYRRALETGVVIRPESPAYIVNGQSRPQVHGPNRARRQGLRAGRGYGQAGHQGTRYGTWAYLPRFRFTDLHTPRRFDPRGVIRPSPPVSRFHEPIVPAGGRDFRSVIRRQRRDYLGAPVRPARVIQSPDHDRVEKHGANHDVEPIMVIPKPKRTRPNTIKAPDSTLDTGQARIVRRR